MIVEQITVTTTPTSVQSLIQEARLPSTAVVPPKCIAITLKYPTSIPLVVLLSDAVSANKVPILDNVTEGIADCSFEDFEMSKALLSVAAGTVVVDVIISQGLI